MEEDKKQHLLNLLSKIENLEIENDEKFKGLIKVGEVGLTDLMDLWEDKGRIANLKLQTTKALMVYESFLESEKKG